MRAPMRRSPRKILTRKTKVLTSQVGINFSLKTNSSAPSENAVLSIPVKCKSKQSLLPFKDRIFFVKLSLVWERLQSLLFLSSTKLCQKVMATNLTKQSSLATLENWLTKFSKTSKD
jgi:hypothetical protein